MAVRPPTEQEKQALADAQQQRQPVDPAAATYGPAGGQATYRGDTLTQEGANDADHRTA